MNPETLIASPLPAESVVCRTGQCSAAAVEPPPVEKPARMKPGFGCYGIIEQCMLRCKNCRKWKEDRQVRKWTALPTFADWKRTTIDLAQMVDKSFLLNFGGGEPFLYKDLLKLVRVAADHGLLTCIATNAYLIDEDMAKRIGESGLWGMAISLDGVNEETHDYMRGVRGSFRRVMNAIEYLSKWAPDLPLAVQSVIYDINLDEICDIARFVQQSSASTVNYLIAMQPNNTPLEKYWWNGKYGYLWPKDPAKAVRVIDELIALKKAGYRLTNTFSQLRAFQSYVQNPGSFVKRRHCNLERALLISSTGDICLCFEIGQNVGNIKETSILDAWYSPESEQLREKIRACKKNCHILINCFDEFREDFENA